MKSEMRSSNHFGRRTRFLGWLLLVLVTFVALEGAVRAEKAKPGANTMMTTSDKAELERQMVAIQERLTNAVEALNKQQAASSTSDNIIWTGAVCLVIGTIAFLRFWPQLSVFLEMRGKARMSGSEAAASLIAEEESVAAFAQSFRTGPKPAKCVPALTVASAHSSNTVTVAETKPEPPPRPAPDPVKEFLTASPKHLEKLREFLQRAEKESEEAARVAVLQEFAAELGVLKTGVEFPALLPAWQMSTALDGLIKQLIEKPKNITAFTLRTVSGALEVLARVCAPGVPSELLADPPIRLLAVDDDPLSRHAVAFALKKALSQPDMAANGDAALALAAQIGYDAIFVDVQMPGMNGFELCQKIHETPLNGKTPVVFVTCQSDADARAQGTAAGGEDMIAKPFLIFEITVKAVSLVMDRRVETRKQRKSPEKARELTDLVTMA